MPICYEIEIDIVRQDETGDLYNTILPRVYESDVTLSNEQLGIIADNFWQMFADIMHDSDPSPTPRYRRREGFRITSVIRC